MKDGFLSKFKAGRYHANPTHTYFSFSDWSIKQQKTLQNSIQIHTTQNWKGTGTYIYSILTHPALRCNLGMLMEEDIYTV